MRAPGRVHITWENDSTLRIDTEAGNQTRHIPLASGSGAPPGRSVVAGHVRGHGGTARPT